MEELNAIRPGPSPVTALPADVPAEVQLLDETWLSAQMEGGARLALLGPEELEGGEAGLEEAERRLEVERSANRALLSAVAQLEQRCAEFEKLAERAGEREAALDSARSALASAQLEVTRLHQIHEDVDQQLEATLTVLASTKLEAEERRRTEQESKREADESRRQQEESETRARELQGALASARIEVQYLSRQLELAERPLSKKIMRRD